MTWRVTTLKMQGRASNTVGMTAALDTALDWLDRRAYDADGSRLGRVSAVLVDADRAPQWVVVRTRGEELRLPASEAVCDGRRVFFVKPECEQPAGRSPWSRTAGRFTRRRGDCV
jgi:hypothetical protein